MAEPVLETKRKISKKGLLVLTILCCLMSVFLWVDKYFHFLEVGFSKAKIPVMEIMLTSMSIILILSLFKVTKTLQIIAAIIAIPLLPMFIIGILSQTKPLASLTLPMMVLPLLASISTYSYKALEFLNLGANFNDHVIPYLNLTTIMVLFAYFDKFFVKLYAKTIPESQMPTIVKEWTYELLDKKIFLKLAYLLLTLLIVFTTVEKLYGKTIIDILPNYKQIGLEALITFVAIDRMVSKWKAK